MTQPKPSDNNDNNNTSSGDVQINSSITQNLTTDFDINDNLYLSAPEEEQLSDQKCDYLSAHFSDHHDSTSQMKSIHEQPPSVASPLSSSSPLPTLERQLSKQCVRERKSDIDTNKNASSPIHFGSSFSSTTTSSSSSSSSSTLVNNNQLHCIPTNVLHSTTVTTNVTTITSVRRPRHKPAERRELLELAVNDVLGSQISMRRAAQKYNLAKSSLCDYVRKNGIILPNLRFKSYQTIPRSTTSDLSGVSNRKVTLSTNTNRQTSVSCKRSGSPITADDNCISSIRPLPTKLSCGVTRKVNITGAKNIDNNNNNNKQHSKISTRPIIQMNNLSSGLDNDIAVSLVSSTCDLNCIRPLLSSDRTGIDSCPSEICLPNQHEKTSNQSNMFNMSNLTKCFTNVISCKSSRVESPWYNAAGLPTQVPMRSWTGGTTTNLFSGSLQNTNQLQQQEQQIKTLRSTPSLVASNNSPLFNNSNSHHHLSFDNNVDDSSSNNHWSFNKIKTNHSSSQLINAPFSLANNYLKALTEHSSDSHSSNYSSLPSEIKTLDDDELSSRKNFLLSGNCCCSTNSSNSLNIGTNFPIDSPISQLSLDYDRRISLNEESTRPWIFNHSHRTINGLSDTEQSRSILDSTQSLRSTYESSSSTGVSYSPPTSSVPLDSLSSSRYLTTPFNLPLSNCQIFPDDIVKLPSRTTINQSSSDNFDPIGLHSESECNNNNTDSVTTDHFVSNFSSSTTTTTTTTTTSTTTPSTLCSFLGLNSINHINSHFCQPSASVFQSNLLPVNQAAVAALLLQYSRAAAAAYSTTQTLPINSSTIPNYTHCPVITSPQTSSQLHQPQQHHPIDILQNSPDYSNQLPKSFTPTSQSIPSIAAAAAAHLPFSSKNHHYINSELVNSLNFCDQQINLLKQLPKYLIESITGTTAATAAAATAASSSASASPPPPPPLSQSLLPPTELVIPPYLTNQSAAYSLRQLATTLFWSSLSSKAIDLLSTFGPNLLQQHYQQQQQQQQQQRTNSFNFFNYPFIPTNSTVTSTATATLTSTSTPTPTTPTTTTTTTTTATATVTPTSIPVTKTELTNFPVNLINTNTNNTDQLVNCHRNTTESIRLVIDQSISSSLSPVVNNFDLLKNHLFPMYSSHANMSHHVQGLINFINKSPTPFHAVQSVKNILDNHGFRELLEEDTWSLRPLDKVYITKNESTIIAAAVGGRFQSGNGFTLLGAHTDSPCLRLKPNSERLKEGYIQLGVETYGGGLWYTWFDRDLKLAGRVIIRNAEGCLEQRLVHINSPIACVPSLAIHLNQEVKTQGFHPNSERHLSPILCTSLMEQLHNPSIPNVNTATSTNTTTNTTVNTTTNTTTTGCVNDSTNPCFNHNNGCPISLSTTHRHPPGLLRLLSEEIGVSQEQIIELELCFADAQPATIGGLYKEFIHAPRLDNLFNSYAGLHGFIESLPNLPAESNLRLLCLYDHEEVGSTSTHGANSSYTLSIIRRLNKAFNEMMMSSSSSSDSPELLTTALNTTTTTTSNDHSSCVKCHLDLNFEKSLAKSFLLSADQAHAIHPAWNERYECYHKPQLHHGLVLKYNVTQRYATNGITAAVVRQIAQLSNVPVQEFVVRQDMHCGSTIGPLLSSQLGVPTVDVGFPQLAMHSCRELCCSSSVEQAVRFYASYYEHLSKIWYNPSSLSSCNRLKQSQQQQHQQPQQHQHQEIPMDS
ncbi:unnamed protein product [Schistosoma turkestanicum]|nr:unnamed protein product [Schistosoma turkestanicum]